jgi:hypothetical protein
MNVRTIEDNFDYQMHSIFEDMKEDYEADQKERIKDECEPMSFSDWLWQNKKELGERVYNRFDEYAGIDDETEKYNFNP